jgi:hypothetical protein
MYFSNFARESGLFRSLLSRAEKNLRSKGFLTPEGLCLKSGKTLFLIKNQYPAPKLGDLPKNYEPPNAACVRVRRPLD